MVIFSNPLHSLRPSVASQMAPGILFTQSFLRSATYNSPALVQGQRTPLVEQARFLVALKLDSLNARKTLALAFLNTRRKSSGQVITFASQNIEGLDKRQTTTEMEMAAEKDVLESSEKKSDTYSSNMTNAMGAVLTYRHDLGMNYNFVLPDLIVGSCLQAPRDVDHLKSIGVRTVFCLQQDPDLEYFGVDICAIQERAKELGGIEHIRAQIRDFDPFDLRVRLPAVIAKLYKAIERNKGITYIHCTAGLGRAPAVALTYMYWLLGYDLLEANSQLLSVRPCFPKLESIKYATCDLLTGGATEIVHLKWRSGSSRSVEIAGLDIGWGQRLPLSFIPENNYWMLSRELPVGKYEYKYIVDGVWTNNPNEPQTQPNKDGHVNNYVQVLGESADQEIKKLRQRLLQDNPSLNDVERRVIRRKLLSLEP